MGFFVSFWTKLFKTKHEIRIFMIVAPTSNLPLSPLLNNSFEIVDFFHILQSIEIKHFIQINAQIGESVVLRRPNLDAYPVESLSFEWRLDNKAIFGNMSTFVARNGDLVVLEVQSANFGQYSVHATHEMLQRTISSQPIQLVRTSTGKILFGNFSKFSKCKNFCSWVLSLNLEG